MSDKAPHEADAEDHHQQQRQGQQQEGPRGRAALLRALASARSYQRALLKMMRRLDLAAQRCDARRRAAWADAQNVAEKERDQRDRERARRACSTSSARRAVWGIPDTPESARAAGITPQQFQCYQEAKLDLRDHAPAGAVVGVVVVLLGVGSLQSGLVESGKRSERFDDGDDPMGSHFVMSAELRDFLKIIFYALNLHCSGRRR